MKYITLILLCIIALSVDYANADELHVVVSGKAIHINSDKKWNENNYGLGFEYGFTKKSNWIPFVNGLRFKDSNNQWSNILGGGIKYRFNVSKDYHFDAGVSGGLMSRYDYKSNSPFIYALPVVSFGNEYIALNATYVPKIRPKMVSFFYFNVSIRILEF